MDFRERWLVIVDRDEDWKLKGEERDAEKEGWRTRGERMREYELITSSRRMLWFLNWGSGPLGGDGGVFAGVLQGGHGQKGLFALNISFYELSIHC